MRNLSELLNILLISLETSYFETGLCALITDLNYNLNVISVEEAEFLRKYLKKHTPITWYTWAGDNYWWNPGNRKPRRRWLKRHIWINKQFYERSIKSGIKTG